LPLFPLIYLYPGSIQELSETSRVSGNVAPSRHSRHVTYCILFISEKRKKKDFLG